MIEGLARKIGYNKVRAIAASGEPIVLRSFAQKTGMKVKIYVLPSEFSKNGVEAVPVTVIETVDGKQLRFEGLTESFLGSASSRTTEAKERPVKQGDGQCSAAK